MAILKSLPPSITKIRKIMQKVDNGVVWDNYGSLKVFGNSTIQ